MTKSKKKIILFSILASVLLIAAIIAVTVCVSNAKPENMAQKAIPKTLTKAAGWELPKTVIKTALGGSAEIEYSDKEIDASCEIYPKLLKGKAAVDIDLTGANAEHNGRFFFGDEKLILSSDELPEKNYGFELKDLQKRLDESVWAPDSGAECALTQDEYQKVSDILGILEPGDESAMDYYSLLDKYYDLVFDSINEYGGFTKEKTAVEVFGEEVNATRVSVTLDNYAVGKIIDKVWKIAKKDSAIKDLLNTYAVSIVGENKNIPDYNIDDLIDDIDDVAHITMSNFDDEDYFSATIDLYLNRSGALMRGDVTVDIFGIHGSTATYSLELGKTLKKFEGVRLSEKISETAGDNSERVIFEILVEVDSDEGYRLSFACDGVFTGVFAIDKQQNGFLFTLILADGPYHFFGEFIKEKKSISLTVNSIILPGEEPTSDHNFGITLNTSAKMPKAPKDFSDAFGLKESAATDLSDKIEKILKDSNILK